MKQNPSRIVSLVSATVLAILAGQSHQAVADDTEIYVAEPPPGANTAANIMFIIDTSGSMDGNVVTQAAWDPDVDFDGTCRDDRMYWSTGSSTAPVCSGGSATDNYIPISAFLCQAAEGEIQAEGYASVNYGIQWRASNNANNRRWEELQSGRRSEVDCRGDTTPAPADGRAVDDGLHPASGASGPYSNVTQGDSWWTTNNRNRTYTFYSGNYLNYLRSGGTVTKTRLEVVQEVTIDTLDRLTNVNVGLTIFNNSQGGRIIYPVTPIATAREPLKTLVSGLVADGFTPLSETLYEVFQYWAGRAPRYSGSVAATRVGGTGNFISPLGVETCAKNFNVLLTDGEPTEDTDVNIVVPGLTGFVGTGTPTTSCSNNSTGGSNGRCLDDIAKYMFDNDLHATTSVKDSVVTYTVGFGDDVTGSTTLTATAAAGGGTAYDADDTASLTDVFSTIIREIISQDSSFTAPAVSVNAFNRTQNLSDLFFTVFEPSENLHWAGNLKKYRVGPSGTIEDADGRNAVDAASGFFADGARSFWSAGVDGSNVELGGAASNLPTPANRNVYTDLVALTAAKPASLTTTGNSVSLLNSLPLVGQITPTTLGLPALDLLGMETLIQWIRGGNVDNSLPLEPRRVMGDPLHSRPVSVIYGGTEATPDTVVYVATNDGYLHAIDANGVGPADPGQELWTYIPSEMLSRMASLRENASVTAKGYGLDGNLVAHRTDVNNDGIIDPLSCTGSGASQVCDRVLLFFGMGRGGTNYYALDVTVKDTPKLLWRKGADDTLIGAGQTWSTPVITRVNISGATQNNRKLVMIVGGGYDVTQDNVPYNVDNVGNRLFMLDAISGQLLWHAGPTNVAGLGYDSTATFQHAKLTHSIPADIRAIDLSGDGFADRLYTADTGGRIWRFDVANGNTAANLVTGGVLASLGNADEGTHPTASARRFYNAPDPALIRVEGKVMLNLAIGSGYRGHPINTEIQDRFYSIRDKQVFQLLSQASFNALVPITDSTTGLIDVTGVTTPSVPAAAVGWKMLLNQPSWQGEKVLVDSLTFNNMVLFSTFTPIPSAQAASSCTVSGVKNTFYAVNVADGKIESKTDLLQAGIAPRAVILFTGRTEAEDDGGSGIPDDDGDGIPNDSDPTLNCKAGVTRCTQNGPDGDPDGDGIPNSTDDDDDGDGIPDTDDDDNGGDEEPDGDDGIRCYIGREGCPVDLDNPLTRTFWTQQNVDTN